MAQLSEKEELELLELERERARIETPRHTQPTYVERLPTVPADQISGSIATERMYKPDDPRMSKGDQTKAALQMGAGMFFTKDEIARADIIKESYPEAEFATDEEGNLVVRADAERPYMRLNTPGQDFTNDILRFMPAAKLSSLGPGMTSRVGLAGAGGAATAYGSEKAAQLLGSDVPVSPSRVASEGAAMMGGELAAPVLMGAGRGIYRMAGGKPAADKAIEKARILNERRTVDDARGALPKTSSRDVFIDPDTLPDEVVYHTTTREKYEQMLNEGMAPRPKEQRTYGITPDDNLYFATRRAAPNWRENIRRAAKTDDLVTLEIPASALEKGRLRIDEEGFEYSPPSLTGDIEKFAANTFQYTGELPPEVIKAARVVEGDELNRMAAGDRLDLGRKPEFTAGLSRARAQGGEVEGGVRALSSAGAAPARLSPQEAAVLQKLAEQQGVRLTKGQATRDRGQLAFEDSARRGGKGSGAQKVFEDFDRSQEYQVRQAAERLNPNYVAPDAGQAGEIIGQTLREGGERLNRQANQAFKRLEKIEATLPGSSIGRLAEDIRGAVPTGLTEPGQLVGARSLRENFKESSRILSDVEKAAARIAENPDAQVNFRELMELRSSIALAQKGAERGDRAALPAMKSALESFIVREATENLANGREIAELFKDAPKAKALWGGLYTKRGKDDVAGGVIEQIINRDYTGEKIANIIVGGAERSTSTTSYAVAKRLKKIAATNAGVKPDIAPDKLAQAAPEFQAVRDAVLYTTLRKGFGEAGTAYKPRTLVTQLDKMLDGPGKKVMEEYFSPKELFELRKFRAVVRQTLDDPKATNPSGSGDRMFMNLIDMVPLLSNVKGAFQLRNTGRAKAATQGFKEPLPSGPATQIFTSLGASFVENPEGAKKTGQTVVDEFRRRVAEEPL